MSLRDCTRLRAGCEKLVPILGANFSPLDIIMILNSKGSGRLGQAPVASAQIGLRRPLNPSVLGKFKTKINFYGMLPHSYAIRLCYEQLQYVELGKES